jgi:ATP-dependent DNA helicase RecG
MITTQTIDRWLKFLAENEKVEFKAALTQYSKDKVLQYCAALSNEFGGFFVLGITDTNPRQAQGTKAFIEPSELNNLKKLIVERLGFRVETTEVDYHGLRVLVFKIPSRSQGVPVSCEGVYWMRAGESLVQMTKDQLKRIFAEGEKDWLFRSALSAISDRRVFELLHIDAYFDKLKLPLPTSQHAKLQRLEKDKLIFLEEGEWEITNFAAILLAKELDFFPSDVSRKASRFLIYEGTDKTVTKSDTTGVMGYAVGFEGLVNRVHKHAPLNKFREDVLRTEEEMFPKQAIRELIANALIHQDFEMTGMSVTIEMYSDRLEVSNPGGLSLN